MGHFLFIPLETMSKTFPNLILGNLWLSPYHLRKSQSQFPRKGFTGNQSLSPSVLFPWGSVHETSHFILQFHCRLQLFPGRWGSLSAPSHGCTVTLAVAPAPAPTPWKPVGSTVSHSTIKAAFLLKPAHAELLLRGKGTWNQHQQPLLIVFPGIKQQLVQDKSYIRRKKGGRGGIQLVTWTVPMSHYAKIPCKQLLVYVHLFINWMSLFVPVKIT